MKTSKQTLEQLWDKHKILDYTTDLAYFQDTGGSWKSVEYLTILKSLNKQMNILNSIKPYWLFLCRCVFLLCMSAQAMVFIYVFGNNLVVPFYILFAPVFIWISTIISVFLIGIPVCLLRAK